MLKNGSLATGNFSAPHKTVCSNTCATPVESLGVVRNATLNPELESSAPTCRCFAPVLTCSNSTATTSYGITRLVDTTSNAPFANLVPGRSASSSANALFASFAPFTIVAPFVCARIAASTAHTAPTPAALPIITSRRVAPPSAALRRVVTARPRPRPHVNPHVTRGLVTVLARSMRRRPRGAVTTR